jgi:hypothetical protein
MSAPASWRAKVMGRRVELDVRGEMKRAIEEGIHAVADLIRSWRAEIA